MIWILQGQANIIAVTLTEKCTLESPVFLFRFVNDESQVEYTFIAPDVSDFPTRYNQFSIVETESPDTLHGEVHLPDADFYHYFIYEQSSNTNLDYTLATTLVEVGKMKVPGESREVDSYTPQTNTNKSYTPANG
jgi:hypothetical protein